MDKRVGDYSFIIGVILAIVLGLVSLGEATVWAASLLVVLGLVVGLINVTGKETKEFLLVAAVLIIASAMGGAGSTLASVEIIGPYLQAVFSRILAFVVPTTVIVALKDIWTLGQMK